MGPGSLMSCYKCRGRSAAGLLAIAFALSGFLFAPPTHAIVDASSQSNTSAPPDGAPWANVGQINWPSGIYLGAGWVLTAGHVGAGNINLSGTVYPWDGTLHWLTNSDGTFADGIV